MLATGVDYRRRLGVNQSCEVHIFDVHTGNDQVVFKAEYLLLEAPNWHRENFLLLNGNGRLWRLELEDQVHLQEVPLEETNHLNNDHVLSPDHSEIFVSTNNDWRIHKVSVSGGKPKQVSPSEPSTLYFLHGVHPTESELAYVRIRSDVVDIFNSGRIHLLNWETGADRALVNGDGPEDGSEYSTDGNWVYFNTEHFSRELGHAQVARAKRDGSNLQQLTFDDRVNWFPHQSSCGRYWVYLSYPPGTQGHPADVSVELKLVTGHDWGGARTVSRLVGGQGTINVNSWSPHRAQFAYVTYPFSS